MSTFGYTCTLLFMLSFQLIEKSLFDMSHPSINHTCVVNPLQAIMLQTIKRWLPSHHSAREIDLA